MPYTPPSELLKKYADVLIKFALNSGEGIKPGEVVYIVVPECAKPMYIPLQQSVLEAGGHPIMSFLADGVQAAFLNTANPEQLSFFAEHQMRGLVNQIDHQVRILAEADKYELKGIEPAKVLARQRANRPYMDWRTEKELAGKLTWTLAMYGTPAMAEEVGMTEEEYWEQISNACYLNDADPIASWKKTVGEIERIRIALDALPITHLHVTGAQTNLRVGLGQKRAWLGGSGRNIPSFELFVSPDCQDIEGEVFFNQPLYRYGNVIKDIRFTVVAGEITEATAGEGQELLEELLSTPGARRFGEFSLTDKRFSRITKVMGETLFDENMGGEQGNMHLAVGNAYRDSYAGDPAQVSAEEFEKLGYNTSAEHCDIISTEQRKVVAILKDCSEFVLYENGMFTV